MAEHEHEPHPLIRKLLPWTTGAVVIAFLYVAWIFFSRWQESHEYRTKEAQQQLEAARKTMQAYGSEQVKVLNFTISPAIVPRGGKALLCYGVSNAKSVTIEPKPDESVWPSLSRCVEASPTKATTYTLTATDAAGHTEQRALTIQVE